MNYDKGFLTAVAVVLEPYFRGSAAIQDLQEQPSLLEMKVGLNGRHSQADGHYHVHNLSAIIPFHRGIRTETKKSPAPAPQRIHGHRTPRNDYGWKRAGER